MASVVAYTPERAWNSARRAYMALYERVNYKYPQDRADLIDTLLAASSYFDLSAFLRGDT